MLDTTILPLIIEEERKKREGSISWRQPFLPVPDRMPNSERDVPRRDLYDSGDDDLDPRRDVRDDYVIHQPYLMISYRR